VPSLRSRVHRKHKLVCTRATQSPAKQVHIPAIPGRGGMPGIPIGGIGNPAGMPIIGMGGRPMEGGMPGMGGMGAVSRQRNIDQAVSTLCS